jgi:glutathione synthase/RimK-type ligase-like ATP-grasp enzyme
VINPPKTCRLVKDKLRTIEVVRSRTTVNVPATFLFRDRKELLKLLSDRPAIFDHGFVIKPLNKSLGKGVYVLAPHERIPRISGPELLEEKITPKLEGRKYWDVRVFVVDGEFVGGIKRETVQRVTNISRGAKPYPIEKRLLKKLEGPALEVVRAIDREAESLSRIRS